MQDATNALLCEVDYNCIPAVSPLQGNFGAPVPVHARLVPQIHGLLQARQVRSRPPRDAWHSKSPFTAGWAGPGCMV